MKVTVFTAHSGISHDYRSMSVLNLGKTRFKAARNGEPVVDRPWVGFILRGDDGERGQVRYQLRVDLVGGGLVTKPIPGVAELSGQDDYVCAGIELFDVFPVGRYRIRMTIEGHATSDTVDFVVEH